MKDLSPTGIDRPPQIFHIFFNSVDTGIAIFLFLLITNRVSYPLLLLSATLNQVFCHSISIFC